MLISFDKSDFKSKEMWQSVLARLNVPVVEWFDVEIITIETERVTATQKFGSQITTTRFNPSTGVVFE